MELITKKEFKVSDNSVQVGKEVFSKYKFKDIAIQFLLSSQSWVISYTKQYAVETTIETPIEYEEGNPGELEVTTGVMWRNVKVAAKQNEPITKDQYLQVEAVIIPNLPDGYTTLELLTEVVLNGIPIFIELFGFYEGQLTAADFDIIRN